MALTQDRRTHGEARVAILAAVGLIGLATAGQSVRRRRNAGRGHQPEPRRALTAYLHDHLAGADAAIQAVDRLRHAHAGSREGTLFASLYERFLEDRGIVEGLLFDLNASSRSAKRAVGQLAGKALRVAAGRATDDLSLFYALEGLAAGVQGKRCMWRALQTVEPPLRAPLRTLEADAVKQWEEIETCRLRLAARLFDGPRINPSWS